MEKVYRDTDVYTAFQERIGYILSEFDNIYVAFSGGKESGLLYQALLAYMEKHGVKRKIGLFHQDFEAQYTKTTEYVDRTFSGAPDFVDRFWVCLPMESKTCVSSFESCWYPWEPGKNWVREMPQHPYVINLDDNPLDFYQYKMPQEKLYRDFGKWYKDRCGGGKTIALVGIRADESLHRYNAIINKKHPYQDKKYITCNRPDVWTAAPLYDWTAEDVWTAIGKFGFDYNRLYDLYYMAGIPLHKMRTASPFNEWAISSLRLYRILEPDAWAKMVDRVGGANFAALYGDTKAMAYREISLPAGYTWESYAHFLLTTLPDETRRGYEERFRGKSDWKGMCSCILKNDHTGRTIKGTTKKQDTGESLRKKYAALIRGKEA